MAFKGQPKNVYIQQKFDKWSKYQVILMLYEYAVKCYQSEGVVFHKAREESMKLVLNRTMIFLGNHTVLDWIEKGGDERKAQDAIKDWIAEAKKISIKEMESQMLSETIRKNKL